MAQDLSFSSTESGATTDAVGAVFASEGEEPNLTAEGDCDDEQVIYIKNVRSAKQAIKQAKAMLLEYSSTSNSVLVELEGDYDVKGFARLFPGEKILGCHARLLHGKVQIYEPPSARHEMVASEIFRLLCRQDNRISTMGSGDIYINQNTLLQPDESFYIRHRENGFEPGALDSKGEDYRR